MSAWERARYIPWDRIPENGENLEAQKERIFRELQRETIEDEIQSHERRPTVSTTGMNNNGGVNSMDVNNGNNNNNNLADVATPQQQQNQQQQQIKKAAIKVPFSSMVLLRQAAFGGCIGSITGAVFGFMDGMRTVGESAVLKNASNQAKGRYLMQGTTRSASIFGLFFGGFHVTKYGIRVIANDPGEVAEIGLAGIISCSALMYKPAWRASMPYAIMLIFMDSVNLAMRSTTS